MFRLLLKKQFTDIFQSFFINKKNGEAKSKGKTVLSVVMFVFLMAAVLGGMFFTLAKSICSALVALELDWMYFLIISLLAISLGTFGSVFNTFATLYKAKDNDLLLSLPIPAKYIVTSRLAGVYLLGLMYSMLIFIPAQIVYFLEKGFEIKALVSTVIFAVIISSAVLVLSTVLGWVVAKISLKVKNKSIVTVILALVFLGLYYFFYFKANEIITSLLLNALTVSEKIIGKAYILYYIGCAASGNILNLIVCTAVSLALAAATYYVITKSFIKIASTSQAIKKVQYREKSVRAKSPFRAFVAKELNHFLSNPNYILNCGLGTILIPAAAIVVIVKGGTITNAVNAMFPGMQELVMPSAAAALCFMASMNDLTAPSISLEGKNIWIAQSMPVPSRTVLTAKIAMHLLLTEIPMFISACCISAVFGFSIVKTVVLLLFVCSFVLLQAISELCINLKAPNLTWTNETVAIKQGLSVMIAIFGSWAYVIILGAGYYFLSRFIEPTVFVACAFAFNTALSLILFRWLNTRGTKIFESL